VALNFYFAKDLFRLEYSVWMGSIEAAYISISRYVLENWRDLTWFPLWYGGIPFQNTYPPLLHLLVAGAAALLRISPARAHHAVTAAFYILGPLALYFLALRLSRSRWYSFWAALGYSILSPSALLISSVRHDLAGYFGLRRFMALVPYGEGPHITSLALLPLALLALDLALEKSRPLYYLVAAISFSAVVLSNWLGALALAMALVAYLAAFQKTVRAWSFAAGIAVLAYAFSCSWIPPSTVSAIRYNAQYVGDFGTVYRTLPLYASLGIGAVVGIKWLLKRSKAPAVLQFFALFSFLTAAVTLSFEWFGIAVVPQPARFHLEMEMALCGGAVFALRPVIERLSAEQKTVIVVSLLLLCYFPIRKDRRYARRMVKPVDIRRTIEYKSARWLDSHATNGRVFAAGTISYWLNAFSDTPQFGGGFDQGVVNPVWRPVQYQIFYGAGPKTADEARDITLAWFRAFGVGFFEVGGPHSQEEYKPFRRLERFQDSTPVFEAGDDRIYLTPQTPQLAYVIPRGAQVTRPPTNRIDVQSAQRYVAGLNSAAARFYWTSRHSAQVLVSIQPGDLLSIQVSYHPGWRASVAGEPRRLSGDGLGQIVVDPNCAGNCTVELAYDGGIEMRIARFLSWGSLAGCLMWVVLAGGAARHNNPK
jgi:hypothetical protein